MTEITTSQYAATHTTIDDGRALAKEGEVQGLPSTSGNELPSTVSPQFSLKASDRLDYKVGEYSTLLTAESIKISRWRQSDQVSASDVDHAADYLVANSRRKLYRHMGTVGGILLGTGASNILAMITNDQNTLSGIIATLVLTSVGTFLIAAHMLRD